MGPPRHLSLLPEGRAERIAWPVPFSDGLEVLDGLRGRPTVVLASGDPFWFGAGSVMARRFEPGEWRAFPGASVFSMAAARLGWPLEKTECLGLHAAPLSRLRPVLAPGKRIIVTLRDGEAVAALAAYLDGAGFGASELAIFEALGGPRERRTVGRADALTGDFGHPVCVAIAVEGDGAVLSRGSGQSDEIFDSDGVMTKRPVRALTLSALAPKPFETLWDIGGGSGSIAIEWLLSDPSTQAISIETRADRAERIRDNARDLGVDRLQVVVGKAPDALGDLARPDVIFVGGGLSDALMDELKGFTGVRLVANAVTLESEACLIRWQSQLGGELLRIELAQAAPLGPRLGWKSAYPVVQWSVTL